MGNAVDFKNFSASLQNARSPANYTLGSSPIGDTGFTLGSGVLGGQVNGNFPSTFPTLPKTNSGFDLGNILGDFSAGNYGSLADWGNGASALSDLFGAYSANKRLGMAEDQFNFQKDAFNQDLSNNAALTNQRIDDQTTARAGALGDSYDYKPRAYANGSAIG